MPGENKNIRPRSINARRKLNGLPAIMGGRVTREVIGGAAGNTELGGDLAGTVSNGRIRNGAVPFVVRAVVLGYDFSGNDEVPHGEPDSSVTGGVTVEAGDYVLVLNETNHVLNDVYVVKAANWERAPGTLKAGSHVQVLPGGTAGGRTYYCQNITDPDRGTDNITFGIIQAIPADGSVSTPKLVDGSVTPDKISPAIAGPGLTGGAGSALGVNVDGSTLEISSDTVRVKAGGIDTPQLAVEAVAPGNIDPSGAPGQTLTIVGGAVAWANVKLLVDHRDVAGTNTTLLATDTILLYDSIAGACDVGLPTGADPDFIGRIFAVKDISGNASGTNKITLTPESPSTIDGQTSIDAVTTPYGVQWFFDDGTNWHTL